MTVLSRHVPPAGSEKHHDGAIYCAGDVTTGEGLAAALAGADVVVDCLEGQFGKAQKKFADGGARLLATAHLADVPKAVALSIVNCDLSTFPYYVSKADKERMYSESPLETVVVRATQFHGLVAMLFSAGAKVLVIPAFRETRFQSISPADVARALLDAALEAPRVERHRVRTVGGPEVLTMRQMAELWKAATGSRGRIVELRLPGAMGAFLRAGKNLIPGQSGGTETFVSWLEKRQESL